ncbi:MAG: hypothetical protein ACRC5C_12420, partial [Bacilli bacterium]
MNNRAHHQLIVHPFRPPLLYHYFTQNHVYYLRFSCTRSHLQQLMKRYAISVSPGRDAFPNCLPLRRSPLWIETVCLALVVRIFHVSEVFGTGNEWLIQCPKHVTLPPGVYVRPLKETELLFGYRQSKRSLRFPHGYEHHLLASIGLLH